MVLRARSLQPALDNRREDVERVRDAGPQWFHVSGEIDVDGPGAATVSVLFPVYFTDKPRFSFGSELKPGEPLVSGNLPTCTIVVTQWNERGRQDGTVIFAGATFAVVTSGPTGQQMTAFWHMEGIGLRGPTDEFPTG